MSYRELMIEIKKGVIHPVYLLYGTEQLLIREVVEALDQAINPGDELNMLRFDCDDTPIQTAVREADTLPFLSDKRLVIVHNATLFTGAKPSRNDHDPDALLRYLENPAPTSTLVLTVYAEKLDERKKLTKAAYKNGKVAGFFPLKEAELREWIQAQCRKHQVLITPDAVSRLLLTCGSNLMFLATELEKLSLYVGANGTIDEDVVNRLASRTLEQDIFVFVDEVVRLRTERALRLMDDLIKNKQAPVYLLFMIARQLRIMLQVKIQIARGLSPQQIASLIGVHPYACKVAGEQAKRFSRPELERLLAELAEIDYKIKTGQLTDRQALEMFLLTMPRKVKATVSG
ncbi:DNA polymerase III subunit delta [Effusibacillus pohliae]|uniref:DNA polymerase III subunit delta n=1 Tax=Effusibacillus pohliae TaxID=232270 RepID=UPI00037D8625|nr:DNA polymerase III subunit delta [Effusibacillus pohliae]